LPSPGTHGRRPVGIVEEAEVRWNRKGSFPGMRTAGRSAAPGGAQDSGWISSGCPG
jgi:hypothetical protein